MAYKRFMLRSKGLYSLKVSFTGLSTPTYPRLFCRKCNSTAQNKIKAQLIPTFSPATGG